MVSIRRMASDRTTPAKRGRGRPRLPLADPARPYSEWPTVQLLAECRRRAIPVVRKGPRMNASKRKLVLTLERYDASNRESSLLTQSTDAGGAMAGSSELAALEPNVTAPRDSDDEYHESIGFDQVSPIEDQRDLQESSDTTSFRLVNVLFLSFATRFDELSEVNADERVEGGVWDDVRNSFLLPIPAFATLLNNHELFRNVDTSLDRQLCDVTGASLARTWRRLSAAYTAASGAMDPGEVDDTQFYAVCNGQLDVLYLHLWLLLKPQLAKHFVTRPEPSKCGSGAVQASIAAEQPGCRPPQDACTESTSDKTESEYSTPKGSSNEFESVRARKRRQSRLAPDATLSVRCGSCCCDHRNDPAAKDVAEYATLRVRMLREQDARERVRFCEERRRQLLGEIRELSGAIAECQQRRWSQQQHRDGEGSSNPRDVSLGDEEEEEEEVAFFREQKRRRVADVARVEQQLCGFLGAIAAAMPDSGDADEGSDYTRDLGS